MTVIVTHSVRGLRQLSDGDRADVYALPSSFAGMYSWTASLSSSMTLGRTAGRVRVNFSLMMSMWYPSVSASGPIVYLSWIVCSEQLYSQTTHTRGVRVYVRPRCPLKTRALHQGAA